jgi:hypothetical protein
MNLARSGVFQKNRNLTARFSKLGARPRQELLERRKNLHRGQVVAAFRAAFITFVDGVLPRSLTVKQQNPAVKMQSSGNLNSVCASRQSLLSQVLEPCVQDCHVARLNRDEGDSHPRLRPRISHFSDRTEVHSGMRDFQPDLCPFRKRRHRFDKAPQKVQVFDVCRKLLFGLYVGEMDAGHEGMTRRAMMFGTDRGATSACRILSHLESRTKQNPQQPKL